MRDPGNKVDAWVDLQYFVWVKQSILGPLTVRVFSLKTSTGGALAVSFMLLNRKNMKSDNVL